MRTSAPVRFVTSFSAAIFLVSATASADVVVASSAYSLGANAAEFHSDVRIFNPSKTDTVAVTPIFYNQAGAGGVFGSTPATLTIPPRTQVQFDNILSSLFGLGKGVFGPIRFQTTAALIVSSSVNNVNACGNGAVSGQWLPGIDQSQALKAGTLVQLASSADSTTGYRSNVVFMNPGSATANVSTNLRKGDGMLISTVALDPLAPNAFKQINGLSAWLPAPNTLTDTNLWLEFTSDQSVLAFASVINNGSGDPFAIVMTAEPNVSTSAPLASYTVNPANPTPGQTVVFTDTSTGGVVNRFWVFGDGTTKVAADPVTTKTYSAAGTYATWLFVDNSFGANSTTKNVTVGAAATIPVSILATTTNNTKWTFVCQSPSTVCSGTGNNNVNLKVGQPYTITWSTPASEAKTHGIGCDASSFLGITQCDVVQPNLPCVVNFTPTANQLNFQGGVYTYCCTQTTCAPNQAVHNGMTGTITIVP